MDLCRQKLATPSARLGIRSICDSPADRRVRQQVAPLVDAAQAHCWVFTRIHHTDLLIRRVLLARKTRSRHGSRSRVHVPVARLESALSASTRGPQATRPCLI